MPWAGALRKRASGTKNPALVRFAGCLERAGLDVLEQGYLSEDLAMLCDRADYVEMPDNDRLFTLTAAGWRNC